MQTVRSAVSDINNELASVDLDSRFSYRFIASKLRGRIENILRQDSTDRNILTISEIWKPLRCIQLEDADSISCSSYYEYCDCLKKSIKKIPSVYTGKYGNFIKIMVLDRSIEFKQIRPFEYKDIKRREFRSKKVQYFWIEEGYMYVPDCTIEEVIGYGIFKDSQEADLFNGDVSACYLPLDSTLLVPDYILDVAKQAVVGELAQINKRLVQDNNPNLNSNEK
jgi:hypothetical protein